VRLSSAVLPLLLLPLACTVKAISTDNDQRPNNTCSANSDCPNGNCSQGVCQTLNGKIEALLVTATPPADSTIRHLTYVTQLLDVPTSGGRRDLSFPGPTNIKGSFALPKGGCYPDFPNDDPKSAVLPAPDAETLPAGVTLSESERLLGLPQQLFYATTTPTPMLGSYNFFVQVPSAKYDVYLVPPARQQGPCMVPPQLYRNSSVDGGVEYVWTLTAVADLTVHIEWPGRKATTQDLRGWRVDLLEPVGGNPISTPATLGDPQPFSDDAPKVEYLAQLRYSTVAGKSLGLTDSDELQDVVRLRPPVGVIAPTLTFDLSGLSLFDRTSAQIKAFTQYPQPVKVQGQLSRLDDGAPMKGEVSLQAIKIEGVDEGVFASYETEASAGDDGLFEVSLPPGRYRVQAVPSTQGGAATQDLAAVDTTWDVSTEPSFQAGKLIQFTTGPLLTGQSRFLEAQVQAVPAPAPVLTFEQSFAGGAVGTRGASTLVDPSGHFSLPMDPGIFDISLQAPESWGFAWFIKPGVKVQADAGRDLGHVAPPLPALLWGNAVVEDAGTLKPLASALVRAYAYLDEDRAYTRDPKTAAFLVEVAEARADANGTFRLLIPESIGGN